MRLFILLAFLTTLGCSTNPWAYNSAPGQGPIGSEAATKPVILLGNLDASSNVSPRFPEIAPEMKKAIGRALVKTGKFELIQDESLSADVDAILETHGSERTASLHRELRSLGAEYGFYVKGNVTDFLHTSDAPDSVQRMRWLETANDALVAIELTAISLQTGRVLYSDQLVATVPAGDEVDDQYGSLEMGSYLFWSTPLGRASTEVINAAVAQLSTIRASIPGVARIASYTDGSRSVDIDDGDQLIDGGIYYVGVTNSATGEYIAMDDDFGRPMRLRIEKGFWGSCTGWLLSKPAGYEALTGATLSKSPFPQSDELRAGTTPQN